MRIPGPLAATCLLLLGAAGSAPAQVAVRQADVPRGSGLDLATAAPVARGRGDVTFDGDSLPARNGIAELPGSEAAFEPVVTTSLTALPLEAGAGYLVNDRAGRTWVLHVIAVDRGRVTVSVAPAAATMRGPGPASGRPGQRPPG
jgi:hypothetical protein